MYGAFGRNASHTAPTASNAPRRAPRASRRTSSVDATSGTAARIRFHARKNPNHEPVAHMRTTTRAATHPPRRAASERRREGEASMGAWLALTSKVRRTRKCSSGFVRPPKNRPGRRLTQAPRLGPSSEVGAPPAGGTWGIRRGGVALVRHDVPVHLRRLAETGRPAASGWGRPRGGEDGVSRRRGRSRGPAGTSPQWRRGRPGSCRRGRRPPGRGSCRRPRT